MKKSLPHFWNESTRGFIKCNIYVCTHKHPQKLGLLLSWLEAKCKSTAWSHRLPEGCTIYPCQSKELLTTSQVLPRFAVHGVQVAFSSCLDAPFITLKAVTIPSSALSQKKNPISSHSWKIQLGALFSLYEQLPLCLTEGSMECLRINPDLTKAHLLSIRLEKGASDILCT